MAEENNDVDIETLSDEEFMKLNKPEEMADAGISTEDADDASADPTAQAAGSGDDSSNTATEASDDGEDSDGSDDGGGSEEEDGGSSTDSGEEGLTDEEILAGKEPDKSVNADKETLTIKPKDKAAAVEGEPAKEPDTDEEKEAAKVIETQTIATNFFDKVSAPFKADGKDIQVRTPEEAIRLMQMGVNYSRRMSEMKPLREMDAMLSQNGLNDPYKLNELIDLSKGGKPAIQKFLKQHNIDPLDLDVSEESTHTAPNYRSDPKDIAFQDAINNTLQAEGGKGLLSDVNKDWDEDSKEALRENPSIFEKLLEQKDTGVYEQINKELVHQRTMGYLADVPFLQAYEEVGNAMQKAGVFDKKKEEVQKKTGLAPIASGSRKAAPKPKTEQPNPNLSSAKPSLKIVSNDTTSKEPDYLSMTDEDFLKLGIPG